MLFAFFFHLSSLLSAFFFSFQFRKKSDLLANDFWGLATRELVKRRLKTSNLIVKSISEDQLYLIDHLDLDDPKDLWDTLEAYYQTNNTNNKLFRRLFEKLHEPRQPIKVSQS